MWKTKEISEWSEIHHLFGELRPKNWIFRGQSSLEWRLTSSLYRELDKAKDLLKSSGQEWEKKKNIYELELIRLFKAQSHLHFNLNPDNYMDIISILQDEPNNEFTFNRLEWLSIMQHYGAPTRLLDWTFSPYIGLFFGVENATEDFCLYALNIEYIREYNKKNHGEKATLVRKLFTSKQDGFFVYPYEPQIMNERIVRQQGLFIVPSSNYRTFDSLLSKYDIEDGVGNDGEEVAYKLVIKKSMILDCILNLKLMNITPETLFPGIEGFCKSFKLHLLEPTKNIKRVF